MTLPNIDPTGLFGVAGKSAVIVGATGAFGKVVCATLGSAGPRLTIAAGNAGELNTLKSDLEAAGVEVAAVARRPNSETHCDAIVSGAVAAHGGVDILVVASGMNDVVPIIDMTPERFQKVMLANVEGAWLMARSVGKQMIAQRRGGKVVFTSSARGKLGHPGMFADDEKAKTVRAGFLARVPLGRLGEPEDLAGPLLFLCSRASDFHTGHILYADGGYTAG